MAWRAARAAIRPRRLLKNGSASTSSAPGRACTIFAKAVSISASLLALKITTSLPIARAAASDSRTFATAAAKFGFESTATVVAAGTRSCSRLKRFSTNSVVNMLTPVALPPGRARLVTSPSLTGSRRHGRSDRSFAADRDDDSDLTANEIGRQRRHSVILALGPAVLDRDVAALDEASFLQASAEAGDEMRERTGRRRAEKPHHRHRCLLRARCQRPHGRCAAEQRDERASPHGGISPQA